MRYIIFILALGFFSGIQNQALAVVTPVESEVNHEKNNLQVVSAADKKELKKQKKLNKFQKRLDKINAKRVKKGKKAIEIDFSDPTEKWLWFGLVLLAAAIILGVLPIVWALAGLVGLAGFVCLLIWAVKKFA